MLVFEVVNSPILSLCFAADGTLISGTKDGRILIIQSGSEPKLLFDATVLRQRDDEDCAINSLCWHPNGRVFAATQIGHGFTGIRDDPDDSLWATHQSATSIALWNDETIIVGEGNRNRSSGGRVILRTWMTFFRSADDSAHPIPGMKKHYVTFSEPKGVRAVAVSRAAELVAWSTGHAKIMLWNPRGQDPKSIPLKHTSTAIAFHPDGTRLAAAQEWGAAVYDVAKRHELFKLTGHAGRVTCLAYRPDGRGLATGSWDGTVRFWDVATGLPIASLSSPAGRIFALAWSPDGFRLAAAGDAGNITVWDAD